MRTPIRVETFECIQLPELSFLDPKANYEQQHRMELLFEGRYKS